jgi:hypothetical protein
MSRESGRLCPGTGAVSTEDSRQGHQGHDYRIRRRSFCADRRFRPAATCPTAPGPRKRADAGPDPCTRLRTRDVTPPQGNTANQFSRLFPPDKPGDRKLGQSHITNCGQVVDNSIRKSRFPGGSGERLASGVPRERLWRFCLRSKFQRRVVKSFAKMFYKWTVQNAAAGRTRNTRETVGVSARGANPTDWASSVTFLVDKR